MTERNKEAAQDNSAIDTVQYPAHKTIDGNLREPVGAPDRTDIVTIKDHPNIDTVGAAQLNHQTMEAFVNRRAQEQHQKFPVSDWDHYEFVEFIGEGGMGQVYKARDPRLKRLVALKFIRASDIEALQRFLKEAQSQARISHEHICKVYEVGEAQGQPYIAMQYIDGPSLKEAKDQMTMEQKVKAIKEVAEALHAAHRLSIVHRDIKPANIMMERNEEGGWCPYVMDFGLARDIEARGQTMTGAIMGTPAYMAPEQARGNISHIDRRTDIYSLGATLYELLVGKPPFSGDSALQVMLNVVRNEVEPARNLDRSIPPDLETIVMKCLEKEQQRRYQSAKALADDLQAYLEGEPIKARRASFTYIWKKRAQKHRALVIVSAVALVAVIIFAALGIRSQLNAREQARLSQQFGERAKEIEGIARYSKMLPLHDTTVEKQIIIERMDEIKKEIKLLGGAADGPGNYALGRGYMSLNETQKAKEYLERAWQSGFRTPEASYALGASLGSIYIDELQQARTIPNKDLREARIKELEKQYREPALLYIKSSNGIKSESPLYVEALLAYYQENYDEAIKKSQAALKQAPWLYEAKRIEALSYLIPLYDKFGLIDNNEYLKLLDQAGAATKSAINMARSDEKLYYLESVRLKLVIQTKSTLGQPLQDTFEETLIICDKMIATDPNNGENYFHKINLYNAMGIYQQNHGIETDYFDQALALCEKAQKLSPESINMLTIIGSTHASLAERAIHQGKDASDEFNKAIDYYNQALKLKPNNSIAVENLGLTCWLKALYEMGLGRDVTETLDRAIECFNNTYHIAPGSLAFIIRMGNAYELRGEFEISCGRDPQTWIDRAMAEYQKGAKLNPNSAPVLANYGIVDRDRGSYEFLLGKDPRETLAHGVENFKKAATIYTFAEEYLWAGECMLMKAEYELDHNLDAANSLSEADAQLKKAIEVNANNIDIIVRSAQREILAARAAAQQGRPTMENFNKAATLLGQAEQLGTYNPKIYWVMGELHYRRAQLLYPQGPRHQEEIDAGIKAVDKALSIGSTIAEAQLIKASLNLMKAKSAPTQKAESIDNARKAFAQAFAINPLLKNSYGNLASEAQQLAAGN